MNKLKIIPIVCCFFCMTISAFGQQNSAVHKNSISANILGTGTYLGFSYERLILQRYSVEVGIGLIGIGAGITVYPFQKVKTSKINPFVGLKYTNHAIVDGENKSATYIPFGITYFSRFRLNFSMDIGPSYFNHKSPGYQPSPQELAKYPYTDFGVWGNLKLGFRF